MDYRSSIPEAGFSLRISAFRKTIPLAYYAAIGSDILVRANQHLKNSFHKLSAHGTNESMGIDKAIRLLAERQQFLANVLSYELDIAEVGR